MPKTTVTTFSILIIGAKGHHLPPNIHVHLVPRTERLAPSPLKDWSPRQGHWSVFRFDDWYQMVLYPLTKYVICLMPKTGSLPPYSLQDWCQKQTHWPAFPFGDWYHMASWPCKNASYVSCPGQAHRHILFSAIGRYSLLTRIYLIVWFPEQGNWHLLPSAIGAKWHFFPQNP